MNVVLTQLRKKYGLPKDVMHYIVHQFRPRAPPREDWDQWTPLESDPNIKTWYSWELYWGLTLSDTVQDVQICLLCACPLPRTNGWCRPCLEVWNACIRSEYK